MHLAAEMPFGAGYEFRVQWIEDLGSLNRKTPVSPTSQHHIELQVWDIGSRA